MNIRSLISKLVAQICEKKYAEADSTLDTVVTEKVRNRIKKTTKKMQPVKNKTEKKKVVKKANKGNK